MKNRCMLSFAVTCALLVSAAQAEVKLNPLFGDHAVLQRDRPVPVWGTGTPGERVTVEFAGESVQGVAGGDGKWRVELPARHAGGPFTLVVRGTSEVTLKDIYVGEVWIASGQSNMDFTVARTKEKYFAGTLNEAQEIAAGDHPMIRMFTVPLSTSDVPVAEAKADWKVCSPETVGNFSAVGYFFARELRKTQDVPVGIITTAFGASTAQAWISREALAAEPELKTMLEAYDKAKIDFASGAAQAKFDEALKAWEANAAKAKEEGRPAPRKPGPPREPQKDQHSPTVLYNAMIRPLHPYAFRGAIWYQGESNGYNNEVYLKLMNTLIRDWRTRWADEFPFIAVQLAGHKAPATQPVASSQIANVREAQRLTMNLPKSYMATAFDIGDAKDVHPKNKQEVGRRLALAARANVYGEPVEWSGPIIDKAVVEGDAIRVHFTHARGLALKAGETAVGGFTVQNATGQWRFAEAEIDGNGVRVKLAPGERPVELRYAWADNPATANLVNSDGLPALPFRTELVTSSAAR